jgi:hypothetical protein
MEGPCSLLVTQNRVNCSRLRKPKETKFDCVYFTVPCWPCAMITRRWIVLVSMSQSDECISSVCQISHRIRCLYRKISRNVSYRRER